MRGMFVNGAGNAVMARIRKRKHTVLLAEDSDRERLLMRLAPGTRPRFKLLHEIRNGVEVVEHLSGTGEFANRE